MRLSLLLLFISSIAYSQAVYNDDIENRLELKINSEPHISHTEECTVQKECLNIALTEQCLIYHNDQWFEFTTWDSGIYYLNIRNQDCRDIRGVQAVLIDGEPCKPESYKIISCISNGHQDDMYAEIFLEENKTYLLLIDGYLHDYCYFDIDISTEPPSFAIIPDASTISDTIFSQSPIINLEWTVDSFEAELMQEYFVLRRHETEKRSNIVWNTPNLRNTFGDPFLKYQKFDTLNETKEGAYHYKISGLRQDSSQLLIQEILLIYESPSSSSDPAHDFIEFQLPKSKRNTPYRIELIDARSGFTLDVKKVEYDKLFDTIKLNIKAYRLKGMLNFNVRITNMATGEVESLEFSKPHRYIKENKGLDLF